MITVLVRHKVADFNAWKPAFDSVFSFHHTVGEEAHKIFRSLTDANDVTVMLTFATAEAAQKFVNSDTLRTRMKEGGVIGEPSVQVLSEVMFARRTSAD
jgi:heme-degrading monooxygenase HmoA